MSENDQNKLPVPSGSNNHDGKGLTKNSGSHGLREHVVEGEFYEAEKPGVNTKSSPLHDPIDGESLREGGENRGAKTSPHAEADVLKSTHGTPPKKGMSGKAKLTGVAVVFTALAAGAGYVYDKYFADPDVPMPERHKVLPGSGPVQDINCDGLFKGQQPGESMYKDKPETRQEMLHTGRDTIIGNDCKGKLYHVDNEGELTKQSSDSNIGFMKEREDKKLVPMAKKAVVSFLKS